MRWRNTAHKATTPSAASMFFDRPHRDYFHIAMFMKLKDIPTREARCYSRAKHRMKGVYSCANAHVGAGGRLFKRQLSR
jgi:hypothetical protein